MITPLDIANRLKEIKPYLKEKFKVKEIGYFGSFAQGDSKIDSDVDILVEFSTTPGWEFFMLEEYLEGVFNRKVDLVTKASLREQLRDQILQSVQYID